MQVRKLCQTVAFLGPATCMLTTSLNPGLPSWAVIAVLTAGLSLGSFALSGLYCTHQDISPKYASVLLVSRQRAVRPASCHPGSCPGCGPTDSRSLPLRGGCS